MSNFVRKPFDPKLFAENDSKARAVALRYLDRQPATGWSDNPDQYGVDLLRFGGKGRVHQGMEVEIKRVWSGPAFPWASVQIPARKEKFTILPYPVEFMVLNRELTHAVLIPSMAMAKAKKVEVSNSEVGSGEFFFQIAIDQCHVVELQVEVPT